MNGPPPLCRSFPQALHLVKLLPFSTVISQVWRPNQQASLFITGLRSLPSPVIGMHLAHIPLPPADPPRASARACSERKEGPPPGPPPRLCRMVPQALQLVIV